jgi:replicative DNA helicase
MSLDLSLLKALVTDKKACVLFQQTCDKKVFDSKYWTFADLVTSHFQIYNSPPTFNILKEKVSKSVAKTKYLTDIWTELDSASYDQNELSYNINKIKKRFAIESILETSKYISSIEDGEIDLEQTLLRFQKTVQNIKFIDSKSTFEKRSVKDHLPLFVEKYNYKKNHPEENVKIQTGYSFFDFATGGIDIADFIIFAGESGSGKSLFLNNFAIQIWLQDNKDFSATTFTKGKNVIFFALEMPYENCFHRFISRLAKVNYKKLEKATLNKEEMARVKKVTDFINRYPYRFEIVDIAKTSAGEIESIYNELKLTGDIDVIFVDYLGIMEPNEGTDEADWLKQNQVSLELRQLARVNTTPVISAVQLNRKTPGKDAESLIGLHRLSRSIAIATHCTCVIQLGSRPNEEQFPDQDYYIIKNRNGEKGKGKIMKTLSCGLLEDVPMQEENGEFKNVDDISDEIRELEDLILSTDDDDYD